MLLACLFSQLEMISGEWTGEWAVEWFLTSILDGFLGGMFSGSCLILSGLCRDRRRI